MREKINAQIEFDFQPSALKLTNQYYAKYVTVRPTTPPVPPSAAA